MVNVNIVVKQDNYSTGMKIETRLKYKMQTENKDN